MRCLSGRKTGRTNQLRFTGFVPFLALLAMAAFLLSPLPAEAVADPEIIQWRAYQNADFLNSLFMGVLGRGPSPDEFNFYITRDLMQHGTGRSLLVSPGHPGIRQPVRFAPGALPGLSGSTGR